MTTNNNINKKTFNLYLRDTKTFILRIFEFGVAATLYTIIKLRLRITATLSAKMKATSTISLRTIKINISETTLIGKLVTVLSIRTISISTSTKITMKMVTTILQHMPMTFVSKAQMKANSSLTGGFNHMTFSPTVATFRHLSVFDPQTLLTLDSMTLGSMDQTS